MKRTRRDEPIGLIIHACKETTKGNSLCSYLYLNLAKMPCFSFSLFMLFFLLQNQRTGGQNRFCGGKEGWYQWEGEGGREGGKRMNTVQIIYTYVCKCKNDTCLNYSRNQGRGDEGEQWRG
jgi:hypothetical protein